MNWRTVLFPILFSMCLLPTYAQDAPSTDAPELIADSAPPPLHHIAIFPFRSRPSIDTRVAATLVTKLSASLEESGKFSLLERSSMATLGDELEFTRKGDIKVKSAAAWGKERNLDYVVIGMVVAAGKGHGGMGVGGVRISAKSIALAVDIQLINCATGDLLIEDTFKEEKKGLGLALGTVEFDPESRRGSEMVASVLLELNRAFFTTFEPAVVTAWDEATQQVTLSYGDNIFVPGQRWELFSADGSDKLGAIMIDGVAEEESTATVVDGTAVIGAIARFDKPAKKK